MERIYDIHIHTILELGEAYRYECMFFSGGGWW